MRRTLTAFLVSFMMLGGYASATEFNFDGQLRFRPEFKNNYDFNSQRGDRAAFIGQRIRLGVNAKVSEDITALIQIQDARYWGRINTDSAGNRTGQNSVNNISSGTENEALDLYQVYFQVNGVWGLPLDFKVGRQILAYGDHRLLGHLGWQDRARSFDAFKFMWHVAGGQVDIFTSKLFEGGDPQGYNNGPTATGSSDQDLHGAYGMWKVGENNSLDLYYLVWQGPIDNAGTGAGRNVNTYGARINGNWDALDYTAEAAFQGGKWTRTVNHSANAIAVKAGYTFKDFHSTRIGVEYDQGSGDNDPSSGDHKTFVFPFHTNHGLYGYMDFFSWGNMKDLSFSVSTKPTEKITVKADYHIFSLAEKNDTWLDVVGTAAQANVNNAASNSTSAGSELDLTITYPYSKALKLVGGYSMFVPGTAAKERTGFNKGDTADWGYLMMILNI